MLRPRPHSLRPSYGSLNQRRHGPRRASRVRSALLFDPWVEAMLAESSETAAAPVVPVELKPSDADSVQPVPPLAMSDLSDLLERVAEVGAPNR